jgi:hypothetical protein
MDEFPHNPRRKVVFLDGGAVFFHPQLRLYEGTPLKPYVSPDAIENDVFAGVTQAARSKDLASQAWIVYLHNTRLGSEHPEFTPKNAYGDPYITNLCPTNPGTVAFASALTRDVSRYEPTRILAESLHHHPLEHGYHHERYLIDLDPVARFLFGLCFCEFCVQASVRLGVDGPGLQGFVRGYLDRVLVGQQSVLDPAEPNLSEVGLLAGGEMAGFLNARTQSVNDLVRQVVDAAGNIPLSFIDPSGAVKGYADGKPSGAPAVEIAWRFGIDPAFVSQIAELQTIGYAADPTRFELDLVAYEAQTDGRPLSTILRPMVPDCNSVANLSTKIGIARRRGLRRIDFYHYGLMQLPAVDRIGEAFNAAPAQATDDALNEGP